MSEIKIDKHVPLPIGYGNKPKYPFHDMSVGDSFFTEALLTNLTSILNQQRVRRKNPVVGQFTMRTVVEDGIKGVRVWRTE